ncbi:MAG: hypothetical protein PUF08_04175 [Clostridiales bacterium]|nr:hypothetical protein [Clostridiales bacterium]
MRNNLHNLLASSYAVHKNDVALRASGFVAHKRDVASLMRLAM